MNYGGGSLIETSGEMWTLSNVIAPICREANPPIVFDVGANIGDYSLSVNHLLPDATIFAFEPAASVFQALQHSIAANRLANNIRPFQLGFSDSERTVVLHSYTADGFAASVLGSIDLRLPTQVVDVELASTEQINVTTIDAFCEAHDIRHIHLLKLDVEGHEVSILQGSRRMIEQDAISLIQFEFGPANIYSKTYFYDFWTILSDRYAIFRIIPNGLVPVSYYGEHREIFLTTNYLAVHKTLKAL